MIASDGRTQSVEVQCKHCGAIYSLLVNPNDLISWQAGKGYIQDLLGYLSAGERELLISGTCDSCWTNMFGDDEDDEYDE